MPASSNSRADGRKEKEPLGSNLSPNFWLLMAVCLVLFSIIATYVAVYRMRLFQYDEKTDGLALLIGITTLVAAALTLWVSWLIKEEAKNIAEKLAHNHASAIEESTKHHEDAIQSAAKRQRDLISFEAQYANLRSMFSTGMSFAVLRMATSETEIPKVKDIYELSVVPDMVNNALVIWHHFDRYRNYGDESKQLQLDVLRVFMAFARWPGYSAFVNTFKNFTESWNALELPDFFFGYARKEFADSVELLVAMKALVEPELCARVAGQREQLDEIQKKMGKLLFKKYRDFVAVFTMLSGGDDLSKGLTFAIQTIDHIQRLIDAKQHQLGGHPQA